MALEPLCPSCGGKLVSVIGTNLVECEDCKSEYDLKGRC